MKRFLWIEASEKVRMSIGLEIGDDISEERAHELLKLNGGDYDNGTEQYGEICDYLTPNTIFDGDGFENVTVEIREE